MKLLIIAAVILGSAVTALARSPMKSGPVDVTCEGIRFLKGSRNFNQVDMYFPMTIKKMGAFTAEIDGENAKVDSKNNKIIVSAADGDQVATYVFNKVDYRELMQGKKKSIGGTFEDGFYWTDGYNTRAKFSVRCSVK